MEGRREDRWSNLPQEDSTVMVRKNANPVRSSGAVDYGLEREYKERVKAEISGSLLVP